MRRYPFLHDHFIKKGSVAQVKHFKELINLNFSYLIFLFKIIKIHSISNPEVQFFLVNAHFSFDSNASFTTLIQSVIVMKYLENLLQKFCDIKPNILFATDLNASIYSSPFDYISKGLFSYSFLNESKLKIN